jgi:hypothetical protein
VAFQACATTLQLRHLYQPFQKGVSLFDQAKPIGEILGEVANLLAEIKTGDSGVKTPETSDESSEEDSD